MSKVKVFLVDDSSLIRRILTEAINSDPGLEVVGTAPHGGIALKRIPEVNPDVLVLDVEMP